MSDLLGKMLAERPWLLADGATGTNFFAAGLPTGHAPELWNLDEPEKVRAQYRAFIEAGADIILTNSFGGTRNRLKLHQAEGRVAELNAAAARLAREVAGEAGREVVVAGSMGPTGRCTCPWAS
jgi:5-methyltetrahydrofolate--homocysteine methyltransferase